MSLYDDLAELTLSEELEVWGSTITFTPSGGSASSVTASVFEDSAVLEQDEGRETWVGVIIVKGSITELGNAMKGDTVTWRSLDYLVLEILGRDAGAVTLRCERAAPRKDAIDGARRERT